jgi:superfamily II DNA/RNA helicase
MQSSYSSQNSSRRGSSAGHTSFGPKNGPIVQRHQRNVSSNGRPQAGRASHGARVKQFIHPSKFIRAATTVEHVDYIPTNRFEDFKIHASILRNVLAKGYKTPTAIQDQTIALALAGKDVVGIANTGTGKTAAFAIPMIQDLLTHMDHRAIILAPTRELAQQIMEECLAFSKGCGIRMACLIGGASMHLQKRDLRFNPRIIVGTPGRIKDHVQQGTLLLPFFNFVVLDEVDRMLDMGFITDIRSILGKVNPVRQSLFFSATMEPKIAQLIEGFAKHPETVSTKVGTTVDCVSQDVVYYSTGADKIDKLHNILIKGDCSKTIIFDDTKRAVERLGRELHARGFRVDQIHGDKSQAQRARALKRLKSDEIDVLVATDVAARGIDVADISHVINYSTPNTYDDYIHRIGRTGRAGKTGYALTFLAK